MKTVLLTLSLLGSAQEEGLVDAFLEGKSGARERVMERGLAALPALAEARAKSTDPSKRAALTGLISDIRLAGERDAKGRETLQLLRTKSATVRIKDAPVQALLDYVRDSMGINILTDPVVLKDLNRKVDVRLEEATLQSFLDEIFAGTGLDFDWRYGALWVSRPDRLWVRPFVLNDEQVNSARGWIARLAEDREKAAAELRKLGAGVIPFLERESSAACKELLDELRHRKDLFSPIPLRPRWAGEWPDKIQAVKVTVEFDGVSLAEVVAYLRDLSRLNFVIGPGVDVKLAVSLRAKDLPLADALAAVTLPRGLDVDLREGVIVVVDPKKEIGPTANHWKSQKLEGADAKVGETLAGTKVDFDAGGEVPVSAVLKFLKEFTELEFRLEKGAPDPKVALRMTDVAAGHVLAWATLPYGLDARIEKGVVVIFERKK